MPREAPLPSPFTQYVAVPTKNILWMPGLPMILEISSGRLARADWIQNLRGVPLWMDGQM